MCYNHSATKEGYIWNDLILHEAYKEMHSDKIIRSE